jgi:hypothetical protein
VPTPFYHLSVANEILRRTDLPEPVRTFLYSNRDAFLFGNTAPDVQVVSGQPRELTHFFDLPVRVGDIPPWDKALSAFPSLASSEDLNHLPSQVAFLAGYLCHLQADWLWIVQIFAPVYGPECRWASFTHRLYLHNGLRAYLDQRILPGLKNGVARSLSDVAPVQWLPFVKDTFLKKWLDFLAGQLQPGGVVRTVEVFAARQVIPPEIYHRLISSEERMDREVFARLPRQDLEGYRQSLVEANLQLLQDYLGGIGS